MKKAVVATVFIVFSVTYPSFAFALGHETTAADRGAGRDDVPHGARIEAADWNGGAGSGWRCDDAQAR